MPQFLMTLITITYLVVVIFSSSFVPGFLFVRKRDYSDPFKLFLSISLSLMVIFLLSFLLYMAHAPHAIYKLSSFFIMCLAVFNSKEIILFLNKPVIKRILSLYFILFFWTGILLLLTKHYSGGMWFGDWFEHYERALFFKESLPKNTLFIQGQYHLTARPPLVNVIVSYFLAHVKSEFYYYQVIAATLNTFVFFGAAAIFSAIQTNKDKQTYAGLTFLTVLLCFNPSVMQNITYVWTRQVANLFVLLAISFYLIGIQERKGAWSFLSFLNFGMAVLAHYSAAPYFLCLVAIEIYFLIVRRITLKRAMGNFLVFASVVSIWFLWAFVQYGISDTVTSNTSVQGFASMNFQENITKIFLNLRNTIIPYFLRDVGPLFFVQGNQLAFIRNAAFMVYQVNLLFMMGSISAFLIILALIKHSSNIWRTQKEQSCLLAFFLTFSTVLGIAVIGEIDQYGLAHICLQPLALLGIVFLSANYISFGRWSKFLLYIGIFIDFVLGIFLHFYIQRLDFPKIYATVNTEQSYSNILLNFTHFKMNSGFVFLGDYSRAYLLIFIFLVFIILIALRIRQSNQTG